MLRVWNGGGILPAFFKIIVVLGYTVTFTKVLTIYHT
jgi:hypothetical protein